MAQSQQKKPNILIMWGDDIGMWNVSRYSHGMMGYRTPNIDRIGEEGATFTDWYAQPRSAFMRRIRLSLSCSSRSATPPASSARTIWAIGTNSCRAYTASTNSSATSTT
jgi:hypothetical protein